MTGGTGIQGADDVRTVERLRLFDRITIRFSNQSATDHYEFNHFSRQRQLANRKPILHSRLITGTGKYPSLMAMQQSLEESNCEMVTVAVRRVHAVAEGHAGLMEAID